VLNSFDDKLIIIGDVEDASTGTGIRQLLQRVVAKRQLNEQSEKHNAM